MPVYITTPQTKTYYIDQSNQGWVLSKTGSITVANGHGIVNNDAFHDSVITVSGSIVADGMYKSGIYSNGLNAALSVDAGGSIHAYNGLAIWGENSDAKNLGTITAANIGIYTGATKFNIRNEGEINAKIGIYLDATASTTMSAIVNDGPISADTGIFSARAYMNMTIGGHVNATSVGVHLGSNNGIGTNFLGNFGTIKSKGIAIEGEGAKDHIENHGTIKGTVSLGAGNDVFDNRDGVIEGVVDGGSGDDTYIFGAKTLEIIDSGGTDTIGTEISRTLANYGAIENLTLLGSANVNGTGNQLANGIIGNSGNNILDGGFEPYEATDGGVEQSEIVDILSGGAGNDTYVLRAGHDKVIDSAGMDTITSTISRSLVGYATIENLTLLGDKNINGTGNGLANVVAGNGFNNILDGGADKVIDTLKGGAGNDTYVLRAGADKVVDTSGNDTITSTITRSLANYAAIENLTLKGTANINATGNGLVNVVAGNDGNNVLDGGTDNVIDTLKGGLGNDTYVLGSGQDKVIDSGGIDRITSTITRSLEGYAAIENLKLLGASNINATGNALANVLTGNSGTNVLSGGAGKDVLIGGAGADKLTGGTGADIFLFKSTGDTSVSAAGQDTIVDFNHAQGDRIGLSGIDTNPTLAGDQAFVFKGTAAFSGTHGELRFEQKASDTYIYGDINGDKIADFIIHLDDAVALQAGDFIL